MDDWKRYWLVYDKIDKSRQGLLWLQGALLLIAIVFLGIVSVSRAITVFDSATRARSAVIAPQVVPPLWEKVASEGALRIIDLSAKVLETKLVNDPRPSMMASLIIEIYVEVSFDSGGGIVRTAEGKVKSYNDAGFLVLENSDGKKIMIPREKVIEITQK